MPPTGHFHAPIVKIIFAGVYVLIWTACGGTSADAAVSRAREHMAVVAAPTRASLEAALCPGHPERAHDLPCIVDQLSSVGATPNGQPIYVARVLPYGPCAGHTYCTTTESVETAAVAGFEAASGTFSDDVVLARELGLEEECVPMYFDRVIVRGDGSLATRPLARVCTQMSAGGSSDTISIDGQRITLSSSFASSWTDTNIWQASIYPFQMLEISVYGESRSGLGSHSHHFNFATSVGSGTAASGNGEDEAAIASAYVVLPNLLDDVDIRAENSLGNCSAPLRTTEQFASLDAPSSDANAPHVTLRGGSVYIEMLRPQPFDLLFTAQRADDDQAFDGHALHYIVDGAGAFVAPTDATVGYRSEVSTLRLSNGHLLARVAFPFLNAQLGDPSQTFLNQPVFVRVGDYRSFETSSADGIPQMSSSMSVNVRCSLQDGVLTRLPQQSLEDCATCMLRRE